MAKKVTWNEEYGTGGTIECICDNCGKSVTYKFKVHPYREATKKLKTKGWLARMLGDEWYDLCSDECFDKFRG